MDNIYMDYWQIQNMTLYLTAEGPNTDDYYFPSYSQQKEFNDYWNLSSLRIVTYPGNNVLIRAHAPVIADEFTKVQLNYSIFLNF